MSRIVLYTTPEVSEILGVTDHTVRDWCRRGRIRAIRLGDGPTARWRIRHEDLEKFLDERTEKAA